MGAATSDHLNVQELCRTGSDSLGMALWRVGPISHPEATLRRGRPTPCPGSAMVLDLMVEVWMIQGC